jgi:phospholipid/cholesterol/gamma-HCH transport system substrate-binding protein
MRGVVAPLIKLVIFLVVTALATYVLAATITNSASGSEGTYRAEFTDVAGLELGDDVRIAGVRVGSIQDIAIDRNKAGRNSYAMVTFTVQSSRPLYRSVSAHLRYRNLVGQRYLDIEQGAGNDARLLNYNHPLPEAQTFPAVDLTVLFQGFQPLTQGLDPSALNKLSYEIIQTLQGEAGALDPLLANLADLTNSLANKDAVIGDVIDNLNVVLKTLGDRDNQLKDLIIQLTGFVSGLAADRHTIGNAITGVNQLATSTAGLLTQVRAPLKKDVVAITGLVATLNRNKSSLRTVLQQLPPTVAGLIRTADYGSWFNFYLCSLSGQIGIGGLNLPLNDAVKPGASSRCG